MPFIQGINKGQKYLSLVQKGQKGKMSLYLKTPKWLHTVYTNKSAWKIEGLAQSVLNMVVPTSMVRSYVYVSLCTNTNQSRGRWILTLSLLSNKKKFLSDLTLQAVKTSLSANAPACVTVWGWEELAGCVQRRAPPPASGIAPDPDDWKGKRMGGSSVYQMFWKNTRIKLWKDIETD